MRDEGAWVPGACERAPGQRQGYGLGRSACARKYSVAAQVCSFVSF